MFPGPPKTGTSVQKTERRTPKSGRNEGTQNDGPKIRNEGILAKGGKKGERERERENERETSPTVKCTKGDEDDMTGEN